MDPRILLFRTFLGITGNVSYFAWFLSPMLTMIRFYEKKSTEEFHPYTYLAGIMSCCLGILYASPAVHPNSALVWAMNAVGLVMYVFYISAFYQYTTDKWRRVIGAVILGESIAILAIAIPTILLVEDKETRSTIVGNICIVFSIILYASPLFVLVKVFQTKSVEFLPFWFCLAGCSNGIIWTTYGLLPFLFCLDGCSNGSIRTTCGLLPVDVNLLVGNGTGVVLCAFQLILHVMWGNPIDSFFEPFKMMLDILKGPKAYVSLTKEEGMSTSRR